MIVGYSSGVFFKMRCDGSGVFHNTRSDGSCFFPKKGLMVVVFLPTRGVREALFSQTIGVMVVVCCFIKRSGGSGDVSPTNKRMVMIVLRKNFCNVVVFPTRGVIQLEE